MGSKIGEVQRSWLAKAENEGWSIRLTDRGHLVFYPPEGVEDARPVTVPGRGFKDNNRGMRNARSMLRKKGLNI